MKMLIATAALVGAVVLTPALASAQERLFDGALGAGAGAIVGGPVGAAAGGVVGYVAGPNIATGLGVRHYRYHHYRYHHYRHHHHVYRESRR